MGFKPLTAGGATGNFEAAPPGNHAAALVAVIDLGTQEETYQNVAKDVHQLYLVWELTDEKPEGSDHGHVIGRVYTYSGHPKAGLRKMLEGWRGRPYAEGEAMAPEAAVGKACLVSVMQEGGYSKVVGVGPLPKGMTAGKPSYKPVARALEDTGPVPDWLPFIFGKPVAHVLDNAAENRPAGSPAPARSNGHGAGQSLDHLPPSQGAPRQGHMAISNDDIPF